MIHHGGDYGGDNPEHVAFQDPRFLSIVLEVVVAARPQKGEVIHEVLGPGRGREDQREEREPFGELSVLRSRHRELRRGREEQPR